jgi:Tetratricopeptide repeat
MGQRYTQVFRYMGQWKDTEKVEVQVKKLLGEEHPDTLIAMHNLPSTFWNLGKWKDSEELHVQVVEARKRVLGREHPDTLTSMDNLASTYESGQVEGF